MTEHSAALYHTHMKMLPALPNELWDYVIDNIARRQTGFVCH